MAGNPKFHALCERIEAAGGEEYIFGRLMDGTPVKKLAAELGTSRDQLYKWRDLKDHPHRREAWAEAQRIAADSLAEDAGLVLDELDEREHLSPQRVSLAAQRSGFYRWLASKRDQEKYGDRPQTLVEVTLNQLHLDALRARGSVSTARPAEVNPLCDLPALETGE